MTQTPILPLDSPDATLALAGGKGVNLAKLAAAGLPAPGGFIVTTAAYRDFVAANDLQRLILDALAGIDMTDPAGLEAASQAIRARFEQAPLPDDLAATIRAAYETKVDSASEMTHHASRTPNPVAVRSSATAEDLPDMSFAGQQDTFLNVIGERALLDAVRRCWSSLWTARAIAYRSRNGIPQAGVALAVIVQAMVQSEASGVLFTANPLTGKRDEVVIDATLGLGEALVSGQVEPDQIVVDPAAGQILQKMLGAKAISMRGQQVGGLVTVAEDASQQQALPDAAIIELARLGKQVEQRLYAGQPQDIEWAWAEGRLTLLQSRAITSLFPVPEGMRAEPLQTLFSLAHVQGMLDPITPAGRDALRLLLLGLVSVIYRRFDLAEQKELPEAAERLFINFTPALRHPQFRRLVVGALGLIESGTGQALDTLRDDPRLAPTGARLSLRATVRLLARLRPVVANVIRAMRNPERQRETMTKLVDGELATMQRRMRAATSLAQRMVLWEEFVDIFTDLLGPHVLPNLIAGMGSFFQLRRLAIKYFDSEELALQAARGLPHNVTTEMDLILWSVAQALRADPDSAARFAEASAGQLGEDYRAGRLPPAAQAAIVAFMDRYGMRGLAEIDLGRLRWNDTPIHIMQVLQSYLQIDDPALAPDAVFREGALAAEAAIGQIVQGTDNPLERRLARLLGRRMRALAGLREYPKFMIIRFLGILREGLLVNGDELVAGGVLNRPDDIFFLGFQELQELAAGAQRDWRAVAAGHRRAYEREMGRKQVPRLLLSDGTAFYAGLGGDESDAEGALSGTPVSPGVVEGLVHVVFNPHESQLAPGEILVCPATDPAWTPLFLAAGGLVMEVGGLMTHGSVVAREYGIPAVVGVHQATGRLKTGQRVRVDGSGGRVFILGEA